MICVELLQVDDPGQFLGRERALRTGHIVENADCGPSKRQCLFVSRIGLGDNPGQRGLEAVRTKRLQIAVGVGPGAVETVRLEILHPRCDWGEVGQSGRFDSCGFGVEPSSIVAHGLAIFCFEP